MDLNDINKTTGEALRDLFANQQTLLNSFKITPLISPAFSISASMVASKRINAAFPKIDFGYSLMGGTLPLINEIQRQGRTYNDIGKMGKNLFDSVLSLDKLKVNAYGLNLKELYSPALSIQKSFISIYSTKDVFANYDNLFSNPKFRNELTKLQSSILDLTTNVFLEDFKEERQVDNFDLADLLNGTSAIAENINETKSITYDEFLILKNSIEAITSYIISNPKTNIFWIKIGQVLFFIVFTLSGLIFDIVQQYQYYESNQNGVTKADLKKLENNLNDSIQKISVVLTKFDFRIINHNCFLKVKSKMKSLTIYRMNKGEEVLVLEIRGKWMKISIIDEIDGFEMTGWVLKKYISK